jgi:hypothetical protein
VTRHGGADADDRLHPAVAQARALRRRAGMPASLVDVRVLNRVNSLFEHVAGPRNKARRDDPNAA